MARKAAKGWTHPEHWKMATLATLCEILSVVLIVLAVYATPFFTDRRGKPDPLLYKLHNMDIKCQKTYCYNSIGEELDDNVDSDGNPLPSSGQMRLHVLQIKDKPKTDWLDSARMLLLIGGVSTLLSLVLQLLVFWPLVLAGKVINIVLLICRLIDFFGAPVKIISGFWFLWYIPDINENYAWWRYEGVLQMDPLPIGLVLLSYILQTLCFVCATLATDKGAKGQDTHLAILKHQNLLESLEAQQSKEFERVSYHPIDSKRSSKILSVVSEHHQSEIISGKESNV